ncbi:arsenate reductase [Streptomyces sp. NL15-2K]|nr:arsenate reductase [Streptomyces sp. NL15-2K]
MSGASTVGAWRRSSRPRRTSERKDRSGAEAGQDDDLVDRVEAAAVLADEHQPAVGVALDGVGAEAGDRVGVAVVDGGLGGQAEGAAGGQLVGGVALDGVGAEADDRVGVAVVDGGLGGQAEGAAGGQLVGGAAAEGGAGDAAAQDPHALGAGAVIGRGEVCEVGERGESGGPGADDRGALALEAAMTETAPVPHRNLSIDQQLALRTAATHLGREFDGTFGQETIERFQHTSYDQFAGRSTIPNFLPLMAERFARQRLRALAKVEGHRTDGKPIVLFLCVHNAGRSQMAMGFFQHLAGDNAVAWSGGSEPGNEVNPAAIAAMSERGIDISREFTKPGPTRSSAPPTSSSAWAAATPAPFSPASATSDGPWTTPPASQSTTSAPSATTSSAASAVSSTTSASRRSTDRGHGCGGRPTARLRRRAQRLRRPGSVAGSIGLHSAMSSAHRPSRLPWPTP